MGILTLSNPRKLGKHAPRHDERTLRLAKYLGPSLPAPPAKLNYTTRITDWSMMAKEQYGDCTCATAGHMIMEWTANAADLQTPTDEAILAAYSDITGFNIKTGANDNGANELDVLNYWRKYGIAGHKILGYAALDVRNRLHIQQSIMLFEACYIGVALPLSAQDQNDLWYVPNGGPHGDGAPGTWGGHAVPVMGYDNEGLYCITWGKFQKMTWQFWHYYCDEAYAVLSNDMFRNGRNPAGFDLATCQADMKRVAA